MGFRASRVPAGLHLLTSRRLRLSKSSAGVGARVQGELLQYIYIYMYIRILLENICLP